MKNTHNVNMRQFAEVNNLALSRLRILIKADKSVRISFSRKNVNHYDRAELDLWLVKNKFRFTKDNVYKPSENGSLFFCSRRDHYVSIGKRSNKLSLCCVECERAFTSQQKTVKKISTEKSKAVDPVVKAHKIRMGDVMAQREIDNLQDVNAWMLD